MLLNLEKDAEMPLYRQIADQIRTNIGSGTLVPGYRLPTVRELAVTLGVSRLTVQTAYAELQSEGFIESVVGRGTFVAEQLPVQITRKPIAIRQRADMPVVWYSQNLFAAMLKLSQKPGVISFSQAAPGTDAMPGRELSRALQEAAADPAAFAYGTPQGAPELRHEIAALLLDRGIAATPDDIMITSGAQQAVDLGFRAFLEPEDLLAVEEPSYPGMVAIAAGRRQRVVGVPVDNEGLNVERLAEICEVYRPALLYTIPTFHNPTGVSLSPARREQLLDLAEKYDFLIMEDDVYGLLSYDGYSPPALKAADNRQRVVYISSFSKILAPGLRIGVMVAPPAQLEKLLITRRETDLGSPLLPQLGLANYLRRRHLPPHLGRVRTLHRERLDLAVNLVQKYLPDCKMQRPKGGLCLWLELPGGVDEREFYLEAIERGVGISPGQAFMVRPLGGESAVAGHFRLGFSSSSPAELERGIRILGQVLSSYRQRRAYTLARTGTGNTVLV
jgi:2-aminoadipate transaminase